MYKRQEAKIKDLEEKQRVTSEELMTVGREGSIHSAFNQIKPSAGHPVGVPLHASRHIPQLIEAIVRVLHQSKARIGIPDLRSPHV